jgi:signal transduction histidine kinase
MASWGSLVLGPDGSVIEADETARSLLAIRREGEPVARLMSGVALTESVGRALAGERDVLPVVLANGASAVLCLGPLAEGRVSAFVVPLRERTDEGLLARAISHDMKAPLRAVEAFASFLAEDAGPLSPAAAQDLARLRAAAARLRVRIEAVVAWLRADESGADRASVREAVVRVRERFAPVFAQRGGTLVVEGLERLDGAARVPFPPGRLEEQLARLLENALDHGARPTPHARLAVEAGGGVASIAVADDGPGLALAQRERALDLFWRGASREGDDAHAGAGLAIVRRAAESRGGSLTLEPAPEGGLLARIRVPLAA